MFRLIKEERDRYVTFLHVCDLDFMADADQIVYKFAKVCFPIKVK